MGRKRGGMQLNLTAYINRGMLLEIVVTANNFAGVVVSRLLYFASDL